MKVIRLCGGVGEQGKSHCVMAATSIVAGEPFSDTPVCVCPTITRCLISLNDLYGSNNAAREAALGHLPWLIIGTRGGLDVMIRRAFMFADFAVREMCGVECDPIVDDKTAYAAADAARVAARAADAARVAARAARAADSAALAARAADSAADAADAADFAAEAAVEAACVADAAAGWRKKLVAFIELLSSHTPLG